MIREIINLSILNAFQVDAADVAYPLAARLPGKRLALLNWGPCSIKISFATKNGDKMEVAPEELNLPIATPLSQVMEALKQRTDCDCVAVLYSAVSLFCEAQNGVRAEPGATLEKRLRHDPKGLIGSSFEDDKVYQMLLAPDHQTRIIFAVSKAPFTELEKNLTGEGFIVMRAQIAPYALLNALLADEVWRKQREDAIVLAAVVSQAHVIVTDFNGERFAPEIFRATPLFLEKATDSAEFIEQLRAFFVNCAESAAVTKRVFGKKVVFRWVASGYPSEITLDLGNYLSDRTDIEFERWTQQEVNVDFKALVEK